MTQAEDEAKELDRVLTLVYASLLRVADQLHGLDRETRDISIAQRLFEANGIDYHRWPTVTVTGSKGKGSTSVLTGSILAAHGYKVGLITSPDMRKFNERIRVDGVAVSDADLIWAMSQLEPSLLEIINNLEQPQYLGPGGVIEALAALIFARDGVDAVVIEAGRGGEFDEARLAEADVSILTPIMLEHPDKLGPTVADIAMTKARIARPGATIVSAPQQPDARAAIAAVAAELDSPLLTVGKDASIELIENDIFGVTCDIIIHGQRFDGLHINLAGAHQAENAAAALLAVSALNLPGLSLDPEQVRVGLRRVRWPGRAHLLQRAPWVLLDGAINEDSAQHIANLTAKFPAERVVAVVSVPRPKDIHGVCRVVAQRARHIIVTQANSPTLTWYPNAAEIAAQYCPSVSAIPDAREALTTAIDAAGHSGGVLALGTQSFVGDALNHWDIETDVIW